MPATQVSPDDPASVTNLTQWASDRVKKAMGAYVLGATLYKGAKALWMKATTELAHSVTVDSRDDLYPDVMTWLYESIPEDRRRTLRATTSSSSDGQVSPTDTASVARLRLHYDGRRSQTVHIGGHRIKVEVETESDPGRDADGRYSYKVEKVTFTARDITGRAAVVEFLQAAASARVRTGPRLYIGTRWGDWRRAGAVPVRDFSTVALPIGVQDDMVGDLGAFFAQEDAYAQLGIPWHRGFVLHGPPGCGKTTIAKALAAHFNLDLYFVPLADMEDDSNLMSMFASVESRSLLLLEDIDINTAARDRDDQGKGASMSALLQSLDGIVTPTGLVTIMTTNNIDALDPALLRPGRADRAFAIGFLGQTQLQELVRVITGLDRVMPDPVGLDLTPADIVEVLKHHIGHPAAGVDAVAVHVQSAHALSDGR